MEEWKSFFTRNVSRMIFLELYSRNLKMFLLWTFNRQTVCCRKISRIFQNRILSGAESSQPEKSFPICFYRYNRRYKRNELSLELILKCFSIWPWPSSCCHLFVFYRGLNRTFWISLLIHSISIGLQALGYPKERFKTYLCQNSKVAVIFEQER